MGFQTPAQQARLHRWQDEALPDTGQAVVSPVRSTPSASFGCSLRETGDIGGGRFDRESGVAHGSRMKVTHAAPALVAGDRVVVTMKVLSDTVVGTYEVVKRLPAATQQAAPHYEVKLL